MKKDTRVIIVEKCKECPHRHYYSPLNIDRDGYYECKYFNYKIIERLYTKFPKWCPLLGFKD